jgi:hypothetical protein
MESFYYMHIFKFSSAFSHVNQIFRFCFYKQYLYVLGVVVHTYNHSTQDVEVVGLHGLYSEIKGRLGSKTLSQRNRAK